MYATCSWTASASNSGVPRVASVSVQARGNSEREFVDGCASVVDTAATHDMGGGGGGARESASEGLWRRCAAWRRPRRTTRVEAVGLRVSVETPASGFRRCGGVMCEATAAPDQVGGGGDEQRRVLPVVIFFTV